WGLYHGTFLVVERLGLADALDRLWRPVRHMYLLIVVMIGWVFFRAETLPGALGFLRAMAGAHATAPAMYTLGWFLTSALWIAIFACAIGAMPIVPALAAAREGREGYVQISGPKSPYPVFSTVALTALLVASIVHIAARTYNPFIYFRF